MIWWLRDLLAHPNRIHFGDHGGIPPRPTADKPTLAAAIDRALRRD